MSLITDPTDNCSLFQAALTAIFVKVEGAFTQAQMPLGLALYPYIPRPPCITKATSRCLKSLFLSQSPPPLPTCPHLQHQRVIFSSCFTPSSDLAAQRPAGLRSPSPETQQWCCQVSLRVLGEIFSRPHWPHTYTQGALLQETRAEMCVTGKVKWQVTRKVTRKRSQEVGGRWWNGLYPSAFL